MNREAAVTLGLLSLAWAAREQAFLCDAAKADRADDRARLAAKAAEAAYWKARTINAAILVAGGRRKLK